MNRLRCEYTQAFPSLTALKILKKTNDGSHAKGILKINAYVVRKLLIRIK